MPELKRKYRERLMKDRNLRMLAAVAANTTEKTIGNWLEANSIQLTQDKIRVLLARELDVHPNDLVDVDPELKRMLEKQPTR